MPCGGSHGAGATEIESVSLMEILDSRGNSTVEASVSTREGFGRAAAPSGASTGEYEAVELPVGDCLQKEEEIEEVLSGTDAARQRLVDSELRELDGTDDFSGIGANAAVSVSLAAAKAAADGSDMHLFKHLGGEYADSLPTPLGNVVGGGEHASKATDIQEFLVAPVGIDGFGNKAAANAEIHAEVGEILEDSGKGCGKGDEGAWSPALHDEEALDLVDDAVMNLGFGDDVRMGLDVAASEMWSDEEGGYVYRDRVRSRSEQMDFIEGLVREFSLVYVEDPLEEDDFEGFSELRDRLSDTDVLICGDDLFVTNVDRIERGIEAGAANSVLIKPNQIGTVTDTYDAVDLADTAGYTSVMSHRSGETEDASIAHLAVAFGSPFIKTGAVGGERTAKLNELIRIENSIEVN
ncbi:MAG: phosphopyruvate hydratase [Halobacteria archaeon]